MKQKGYLSWCLIGILCTLLLSGCGGKSDSKTVSEKGTGPGTEWRSGGIWDVMPKPDTDNWKVSMEMDDYLDIEVKGSRGDYDDYVNQCRDEGFVVDLYNADGYYTASNEDEYYINVSYYEDDKIYEVTLDFRGEELTEEEAEKNEAAKDSDREMTSSEVDPEFKAAMDSYEAFFNEYCEFMKSYNESSDPVSLAGDYADYMKQYADTMEKISQIDENTLSQADALYYTEVVERITQKVAEVSTELES